MSNTLINGLTAVHAGSGGTLVTMDICKTPPFCQPVPFSNVAMSSDATGTASSVLVNGNPVCHVASTFAKSSGDEAGTCGGIMSGTIAGQAEFITFSPNVMIEGQPAVRQSDMMVSNMRNTAPAPLQQAGAGIPQSLSPEETEEQGIEPTHRVDVETGGPVTPRRRHFVRLRRRAK
ncbi:MAG: DUF4150 domain-containing protein [Pseudomonadales bacterium]|nr:DUF4150 domain-containing protein [Pseudomonadales bacterium]